jgi:hypothetical protein
MIWVALFLLAFFAVIVYTKATVETIFAFVQAFLLLALAIGFIAGLFFPR